MSEDKNKVNENLIDFTDEKEPIDSIEKTVEDLKRKIQEISEEDAAKEEPASILSEQIEKLDDLKEKTTEKVKESLQDQKEKLEDLREKTTEKVKDSISDLKSAASQAQENTDLQKTVTYIKDNAVKAVELAKGKFDEVSSNPTVAEYADKTQDAFRKAQDYAEQKAKIAGEFVDSKLSDETKEKIANVSSAVNDKARQVVTSVNEYLNRPEVKEKIDDVVTKTSDIVKKGTDTVKGLLKKEDAAEGDDE